MNRKGTIGGSDVAKLQDPNNWFEMWEIKTGRKQSPDLSDVLPVAMGATTEALNHAWFRKHMTGGNEEMMHSIFYEERTEYWQPNKVDQTLSLQLFDDPDVIVANIDCIYASNDESNFDTYLVEFKHTHANNRLDNVCSDYMPQIQFYLNVAKIEKAYLSVLFGNNRHEVCWIGRSREYFDKTMINVKNFWAYVRDDTPPPMEQVAIKEVSVDKVIVDGLIARDVSKSNSFTSSADIYASTLVSAKANAEAKKSLLEELKDTDREVYNDQVRVYRTKNGRRVALQNKLDVA